MQISSKHVTLQFSSLYNFATEISWHLRDKTYKTLVNLIRFPRFMDPSLLANVCVPLVNPMEIGEMFSVSCIVLKYLVIWHDALLLSIQVRLPESLSQLGFRDSMRLRSFWICSWVRGNCCWDSWFFYSCCWAGLNLGLCCVCCFLPSPATAILRPSTSSIVLASSSTPTSSTALILLVGD